MRRWACACRPAGSPELLGADVNRLSLVVLEFPKFRDGRAFSWARMLRTRLGFKGEIRAVGDFLYDQINYQHRVGFDAWEVPDAFTLAQFQRALTEMTNVYQPSADGRKTIRDLRASRFAMALQALPRRPLLRTASRTGAAAGINGYCGLFIQVTSYSGASCRQAALNCVCHFQGSCR